MPGRLDQAADRKTSGDAEEILEACATLEAELAELRAAYEQYFLGVERHPPVARHDALKRKMQDLKGRFIQQTAVKFRIQTVSARLTTFERLWDRSLKEIEAGTYRRDLNRAKRHQKERELRQKKANVSDTEDLDLSDLDGNPDKAMAPATGPAAAITSPTGGVTAAGPPPPPPSIPPAAKPSVPAVPIMTPPSVPPVMPPTFATAPAGPMATASPFAVKPSSAPPPITEGLTDQKIKAIYDAYVMAKRRCGEDTKGLTLDSVASTLRKQVPELMKQHQAKSVEFKVVIKDGRAVLRALPRD